MRKKTYLSFKDLRAFYDSDTGKLRLTSGDQRLASQRWGLTLDRDTHEKAVLEQQLAAAGLAPERDLSAYREPRLLAGSSSVGNHIMLDAKGFERGSLGPYIGRTSDGTDEAVFYSPLAELRENLLPLCLISGRPGSGKSFAALKIVDGMLQQGATVGMIDPRADFAQYVEQNGGQLLELRNQAAGLLNPFELEGEAERIEAVTATLMTLLGGEKSLTLVQHGLLEEAISEASAKENPSLSKVMHQLSGKGDQAQALFDNLRFLRELPLARLIFQSSDGPGFELEAGLNLVTLRGLDLPSSSMAPNTYSNSNLLALAIFRLMHLHLRQALTKLPRATPKALVVEESWALMQSPKDMWQLRKTFGQARPHRLATILIAQDPADFNGIDVNATRLLFRQNHNEDISYLTQHTTDHAWQDEQYVRQLMPSLGNGECVMEDGWGRRALVQISAGDQRLRDAFSADPAARGRTHLS